MKKSMSAWRWVPTLYFAEGLPYVAVTTLALIMYKRLGLSNAEIALYTSWLNLPWVIKPLWSPFVDLLKSKRWWIVVMQSLIGGALAGVAFFIPTAFWIQATLACFLVMAFASATHDIAADGFYMLGLDEKGQSFFVGIRNLFYRLANIFGQGLLVMLAGWMEDRYGDIPLAWCLTFSLMAGLFIAFTLYHTLQLPCPEQDEHPSANEQRPISLQCLLVDFMETFISFFNRKEVGLMLFFLLTYRLGEAQLVKIASPFLLDTAEAGGLALSTSAVGAIYGTVGVIALMAGGILSGILVSQDGLCRWLLPMALAINLPDLLYLWLAVARPDNVYLIATCVAVEQLGYGFGFTAYTLYLIRVADGPRRTAHYAIGTGLMALGMMLPGMPAGWIQEQLGYPLFFVWVCLCTLPGIWATWMVASQIRNNLKHNNHE
ncbi:MAG: MFS transporter [Bacteroides sp.]|nr:MFS transporter [Bacteroides sp.]